MDVVRPLDAWPCDTPPSLPALSWSLLPPVVPPLTDAAVVPVTVLAVAAAWWPLGPAAPAAATDDCVACVMPAAPKEENSSACW